MKLSDLHTHTVFSDGKNTPEEMVLSAVRKGLFSFGISDHSFTDFDSSYCMKKEKTAEYISQINCLKEKYSDKIQLFLGIEADVNCPLLQKEAFDYIIGDSHYVKTPDGFMPIDESADSFRLTVDRYFDSDAVKLAVSYFEGYVQGIQELRPHILGHIDLVRKFSLVDENDSRYRKSALSALIAALEITNILELNTGALSRGYKTIYPSKEILKEIKAHGGKIILSSDSHSSENIAYLFDNAIELLRSCNINTIFSLNNGFFEEIKI